MRQIKNNSILLNIIVLALIVACFLILTLPICKEKLYDFTSLSSFNIYDNYKHLGMRVEDPQNSDKTISQKEFLQYQIQQLKKEKDLTGQALLENKFQITSLSFDINVSYASYLILGGLSLSLVLAFIGLCLSFKSEVTGKNMAYSSLSGLILAMIGSIVIIIMTAILSGDIVQHEGVTLISNYALFAYSPSIILGLMLGVTVLLFLYKSFRMNVGKADKKIVAKSNGNPIIAPNTNSNANIVDTDTLPKSNENPIIQPIMKPIQPIAPPPPAPKIEEVQGFIVNRDAQGYITYIDKEGHRGYKDKQGDIYFKNNAGYMTYYKNDGTLYYKDAQGKPFFIDTDGVSKYFD